MQKPKKKKNPQSRDGSPVKPLGEVWRRPQPRQAQAALPAGRTKGLGADKHPLAAGLGKPLCCLSCIQFGGLGQNIFSPKGSDLGKNSPVRSWI